MYNMSKVSIIQTLDRDYIHIRYTFYNIQYKVNVYNIREYKHASIIA